MTEENRSEKEEIAELQEKVNILRGSLREMQDNTSYAHKCKLMIRSKNDSIFSHFLFQNEQQQADLERVTVQLSNARRYVAALRNIIGQFRAIVEELVGQEDNLQIVSCIFFCF